MKPHHLTFTLALCVLLWATVVSAPASTTGAATAEEDLPTPRVNVPYWPSGAPYPSHAIFWFGEVNPSNNYADVRLIYDDTRLEVVVHVIDRVLQYDSSPSPTDLAQWDAVTLYLNMDGSNGTIPGKNAYRFDAQLNWWEPRDNWQAAYQGNGSGWIPSPLTFVSETGWRGEGLNDSSDDKGWNVVFSIPFASLGLSRAPSQGTIWGLALAVHDRDDVSSPALPDTIWPEKMSVSTPATWGQLHFAIPVYERPLAVPLGITTIRQGLNGVNVVDGHVGGHTTCGENLDHWSDWGNANYAGFEQINIQNQWDISDWPCFSKFFVTFPLDTLPKGQSIISATLTMYLFGNSGAGQQSPESYIQVLTVGEDWDEAFLTWNNAPLATENISGTWVKPLDKPLEWPGVLYQWDVSRALAQAYVSGGPLRLALYSADGERHSGKYFSSSDTGDWNAVARPTLHVTWGRACDVPNVTCAFTYLPLARH